MKNALYYITGLVAFALLCAIVGYVVFRGKGAADSRYEMAVASLFSAPLFLFLLFRLNLEIAAGLKLDIPNAVKDYLFGVLFYGMMAVLAPIGWIHYVLTATFISLAWFANSTPRRCRIALGLYATVLLLYVGYTIWWYVTGQQLTFP